MSLSFFSEKINRLEDPKRYELLSPETILKECGFRSNCLAADIGCGTGFFTIPASRILKNEGKIYAFDIDKNMLRYLRTRLEKSNIVPILLSNPNKLPLKDKLLDYVILTFILNELENPFDFLKEVKRVLISGGRLCFIDWENLIGEEKNINQKKIDRNDILKWLQSNNFNIFKVHSLNSMHYLILADVI